jgi:thioesterase domain-containing protein/acyl carrier protein
MATGNVESMLTRWWRESLALEVVSLDDDFFELGGDSLLGVQLFSEIQRTYGLELGLSTLFDARTIRQLAQLIRQSSVPVHVELGASSSVVPIQRLGSRHPLYLIPGGYGTTVLPFREVSLLLGPDQPVYGFEAKKPEPNQELESIPQRAARFVEELRSVQPKGPYFLLGWCGGGYIAFEMAHLLSKAGEAVPFLGIVDCAVPRCPETVAARTRLVAQRLSWRLQSFLRRGPKGMASRLMDLAKSLGKALHLPLGSKSTSLADDPVSPLPQAIDDMDERAWRIVERYFPKPYSGKCVLINGKETWAYGGVSPDLDPRLAWFKLFERGCEVKVVPGDHMELLKAPHSRQFAAVLKDCLERYG